MRPAPRDEAPVRRRVRFAALAAVVLLAVVWFGGLGHRKLIKPDEGRYAEIPREMVATGDWLTPRLNGLKYFEKPPLQYWTTALAYEAFGETEWTSRLWTALTGFAGVLVVGCDRGAAVRPAHRPVRGRRASRARSRTCCSSHFNTLDMGLTLFMTTTWCAVLLARDAAPARGVGRRALRRPSGATPGVARLDAGRVGGARARRRCRRVRSRSCCAAPRWSATVVVSRDWALVRMLDLVRGLALFALIAGPWFVAVSKANPDFAHFFFIHEHVERFLTTEHRREGPWWYFVPVVVVGSLPWLSLLPGAIVRRLARAGRATASRPNAC